MNEPVRTYDPSSESGRHYMRGDLWLSLGWPVCVCGHGFHLHNESGCRALECLIGSRGEACRYYRPATEIADDSPAMLGNIVAGHFRHIASRHPNVDELTVYVRDLVSQIVSQWAGWKDYKPSSPSKPEGS